jgi:retron-type reverse transcriptase
VPKDWKKAKVVPIYKKGQKSEPGNYRPVSLTSVPCKILESMLKDYIMEHLTNENLINDSQHGFMPGRSCASNLTIFLDALTKEIDNGKAADVFYLDFAKAFDKVPHGRLLAKVEAKGIQGDIL